MKEERVKKTAKFLHVKFTCKKNKKILTDQGYIDGTKDKPHH
jgi:hypothetical protein